MTVAKKIKIGRNFIFKALSENYQIRFYYFYLIISIRKGFWFNFSIYKYRFKRYSFWIRYRNKKRISHETVKGFIDELDKSVSMTDDRIEKATRRENAKLCIFDTIQAYLGGVADMNRTNMKPQKWRRSLEVLLKEQASYRGMGSVDFFAVARSVMLVGRIEVQSNLSAKNNLAAFGHLKAFELAEDGFHWLGDYEITADEDRLETVISNIYAAEDVMYENQKLREKNVTLKELLGKVAGKNKNKWNR